MESIQCPFTIVIDTREQIPYSFAGLRAGFARGNPPVVVPTMRAGLTVGDYSIFGYPNIVIERKSKSDLYGSVSKRSNFIGRLERMTELIGRGGYAAVVVEADRVDLIEDPPRFSKLHPRSLSHTLIAWEVRYQVRWHFMRSRESAEVLTYRLFERWYIDHSKDHVDAIDLPEETVAPL